MRSMIYCVQQSRNIGTSTNRITLLRQTRASVLRNRYATGTVTSTYGIVSTCSVWTGASSSLDLGGSKRRRGPCDRPQLDQYDADCAEARLHSPRRPEAPPIREETGQRRQADAAEGARCIEAAEDYTTPV